MRMDSWPSVPPFGGCQMKEMSPLTGPKDTPGNEAEGPDLPADLSDRGPPRSASPIWQEPRLCSVRLCFHREPRASPVRQELGPPTNPVSRAGVRGRPGQTVRVSGTADPRSATTLTRHVAGVEPRQRRRGAGTGILYQDGPEKAPARPAGRARAAGRRVQPSDYPDGDTSATTWGCADFPKWSPRTSTVPAVRPDATAVTQRDRNRGAKPSKRDATAITVERPRFIPTRRPADRRHRQVRARAPPAVRRGLAAPEPNLSAPGHLDAGPVHRQR